MRKIILILILIAISIVTYSQRSAIFKQRAYFTYGDSIAEVKTVGAYGCNYTTIQGALNTSGAGGITILVYPGTYAEAISFTGDNQKIIGVTSPFRTVVAQADAVVCDVGDYTGCIIENITFAMTDPTTAKATIEIEDGDLMCRNCFISNSVTNVIAAATQPSCVRITATGEFYAQMGLTNYTNDAASATANKVPFIIDGDGYVSIDGGSISVDNTAATSVTALATFGTFGELDVKNCNIEVDDAIADYVVGSGYVITNVPSQDFRNNTITVTRTGAGSVDVAAFYVSGAGAATVTSYHNTIDVYNTADAAKAWSYYQAGTPTIISSFDNITAAIGYSGTVTMVGSQANGDLSVTGDINIGNSIIGTSVNITNGIQQQLTNILANTLTSSNWSILSNTDQNVSSTSTIGARAFQAYYNSGGVWNYQTWGNLNTGAGAGISHIYHLKASGSQTKNLYEKLLKLDNNTATFTTRREYYNWDNGSPNIYMSVDGGEKTEIKTDTTELDGLLKVNQRSSVIDIVENTDITAAINTFYGSNDVLYLPEGTYLLNNTDIVFTGNNQALIGSEIGTTILKIADGTNDGMAFDLGAYNNIKIANLTLDGNTANNTASFFNVENGTDILLERVTVENCASAIATEFIATISRAVLNNCYWQNNDAIGTKLTSLLYSTISNCHFLNNGSTGLQSYTKDLNIDGNHFYGNAIGIQIGSTDPASQHFGVKTQLVNNTINHNGTGIQLVYAKWVTITGNSIMANDDFGIRMRGSYECAIVANEIWNNSYDNTLAQVSMVTLTNNCVNNIFAGNNIVDMSTATYGIEGDANATNNVISNNYINTHNSGYINVAANNDILNNTSQVVGSIDNNVRADNTTFTGSITPNLTINPNGTIADNDATPDVSGYNVWIYNGSANSVVVTDLDNPTVGAIYYIRGNSDTFTITINDGGNFFLAGGVNFTMGARDYIVLRCHADNEYEEISRSNN